VLFLIFAKRMEIVFVYYKYLYRNIRSFRPRFHSDKRVSAYTIIEICLNRLRSSDAAAASPTDFHGRPFPKLIKLASVQNTFNGFLRPLTDTCRLICFIRLRAPRRQTLFFIIIIVYKRKNATIQCPCKKCALGPGRVSGLTYFVDDYYFAASASSLPLLHVEYQTWFVRVYALRALNGHGAFFFSPFSLQRNRHIEFRLLNVKLN